MGQANVDVYDLGKREGRGEASILEPPSFIGPCFVRMFLSSFVAAVLGP